MLVSFYQDIAKSKAIVFETSLNSAKEIFSYIKYTYGEEISDAIVYHKQAFVGVVGDKAYPLDEVTLFSDLPLYEQLHIFPKIEGNEAVSGAAVLAALAKIGVVASIAEASTATVLASIAIAAVANIAIGIGVSMAVSALLSPDSSFNIDPSKAQKNSKMFNSALTITEQGGSVPLTYGNPYCGGTLISSGLFSSDDKSVVA